MLLSCSDKVSNIAISPSSPKDRYKTYFENCVHIFSEDSWLIALTVQSFRLNYTAVIQRALSKKVGNSQTQICDRSGPTPLPSLSPPAPTPTSAGSWWGALPLKRMLLTLGTQDGAGSQHWELHTTQADKHRSRTPTHTVGQVKDGVIWSNILD